MHDRLGVHDDVDPVRIEAEEVMEFDHLERLVHQGGGADGHAGPHVPVGMSEGSLRAGRGDLLGRGAAERAAAGGEMNAAHPRRILAAHALEDSGVLGVHGQDPRSAGLRESDQQPARDHHGLLVREPEIPSPAEHRRGRRKPGGADDAVDGDVEVHLVHQPRRGAGPGEQASPRRQVRLERSRGRRILETHHLRPELHDLIAHRLPGPPGRQAHDQ